MINPEILGQRLINLGFSTWFRYMFQVIEGRPFVVEAIHKGLFEYFEQIYNGDIIRACLSLPPRAGKTVMSEYFVAWCITNNPACNIIYTSYSQTLLTDIALKVASILENPIYKAMYPHRATLEQEEASPTNDFWKDYLIDETGKNTYSSRKITTYRGGTCLFSSVGSQITGYGAGIRNCKKFSGMLIIDDPQKPADIRSELMRENVVRYYEETLLSRLNNAKVPIICIQQRLHLDDLTGILERKYNYDVLRKPLLDEKGVCQIPSQYTPERIDELKLNAYMFSSQYQQNPIPLGGNMIKSEWFKYYQEHPQYNKIFITADTAQKTKECNDYSVFCVWGVANSYLYLIDLIRGKWEAPDLLAQVKGLINRYRIYREKRLSECLIEDKSSGTGLIQTLKRECLVPIRPIQVDKDKVTRVDDALPYIANGYVHLPYNPEYGFNKELINECELFARDMSHKHDDQVDNLTMAIQFVTRRTSIYDAI